MAYGDDITEGLPYNLSNPDVSRVFQLSGEAYDVSIGGLPFYVFSNDDTPYRRATAQYRKQQIDQTNEPGEQTLTGWWLRSQSSFHNGSGITFYDPSAGEIVQHRFYDSKGINVWNKGEATLLKDVTQSHEITGDIATNGVSQQQLRPIEWTISGTTYQGILLHDEYDVDKIDSSGNVTHFVDYNSGTDSPVYAVCDDGTNAYWITNTATKKTVYKKPLTGNSSTSATAMFDEIGTISNAVMEYVKNRIVMCADNKVYEFAATAVAMPTAVYTHPSTTHVYTSITASGTAIYTAGYNGIQSTIEKFVLNTSGAMPTLTSAITAAELPTGEVVHAIRYYLGYMLIGTSKGVRVAAVSEQDGSLNYGPLIVETTQPVYAFATRDRFVWCAAGVKGEPGLIRIDLGAELDTLRFAYANDIYYPNVVNKKTTAVSFIGTTNRLAFTTNVGYTYLEHATNLASTGYLQTGAIRYNTLENKLFKLLNLRGSNAAGNITIHSVSKTGVEYSLGEFSSEVGVAYPSGAQEYLSFKFTFTRSTTDATKGPTLNGYQAKSLPAVPRQRLIQYPLACFDNEKDKYGTINGYENAAFDRLAVLEAVESTGDSLRVEDFRTGESYVGLIEEITFINSTPPDKRFSGFGGVLYVTIRSL